jgi:diguanylate cyclase (GGDEF)-like protein
MNEFTTGDLLRIAVLGGFVGLVIFVASYASVVWIKRNKGSSTRPVVAKVGSGAIVLGVLGLVASWAFGSLVPRPGVVDGNNLFVVHNRTDSTVSSLAEQGQVKLGAVVAEFRPSGLDGQLAAIDNQIKEALAQADNLRSRALPLDAVLLQRQAQSRSQLSEQRQFGFELQRSGRILEREHLALQSGWAKETAQIGADLASSMKSLETTTAQVTSSKAALDRVTEMFRQQLTTAPRMEERTSAFLAFRHDQDRDQVAVTELQRRAESLNERYKTSNTSFTQQVAAVRSGMALTSAKVAELGLLDQEVERQIGSDRLRAAVQVEGEVAAARMRVETLRSERRTLLEATLVKAPFGGKIVYRHPSPGLAADGAPVLALSASTGFVARVLMSEREAEQIKEAGLIWFALADPSLVKQFSGTFQMLEKTSEANRVIATFAVEVPVETVTDLGAGREVKIRLLWQPPFYTRWGFQAGASLSLLGFLCVGVGTLTSMHKDRNPPLPGENPKVQFQYRRGSDGIPSTSTLAGNVLTRDQFLTLARAELEAAKSRSQLVGVVLIRINNLGEIIEACGPDMGDQVLRVLAERCSGQRAQDRVGRWSGNELALLLPDTDMAGVEAVANRARVTANRAGSDQMPPLDTTIRAGVANPLWGEASILQALEQAALPTNRLLSSSVVDSLGDRSG